MVSAFMTDFHNGSRAMVGHRFGIMTRIWKSKGQGKYFHLGAE
jgi:hypothetical protein